VQCMGENGKKGRQEGQTESAGKEKGNAVGTGSGPSMQGRYAHYRENPLPRETRVTCFSGTTPFGSACTKGAGRAVHGSCSAHAPPTAATPAMIHHARELGWDQDSRLIVGPYWGLCV
jgi:hypothetical protein